MRSFLVILFILIFPKDRWLEDLSPGAGWRETEFLEQLR